MRDLPDHYPIAEAPWEEKLAWLAAAEPPFARIRQPAPWLTSDQHVQWYLGGLRTAMADAKATRGLRALLSPIAGQERRE